MSTLAKCLLTKNPSDGNLINLSHNRHSAILLLLLLLLLLFDSTIHIDAKIDLQGQTTFQNYLIKHKSVHSTV